MGTLKNYFSPKSSVIAERFKFHGRYQSEDESISRYIVELKKLTSTCDFGPFLDESLKDRLVCGLMDGAIQKKNYCLLLIQHLSELVRLHLL